MKTVFSNSIENTLKCVIKYVLFLFIVNDLNIKKEKKEN